MRDDLFSGFPRDSAPSLEHAGIADLVIDERRRTQAVALRRINVDPQRVLPFPGEPSGGDAGTAVPLGEFAGLSDGSGCGLGDRPLQA